MELDGRQRWELALVVGVSVLVTAAAVGAGRFNLVSGTRAEVLYDQRYASSEMSASIQERIEGSWTSTAQGLMLQPGQSGSVTVRIHNKRAGRPVVFLFGQGGDGFRYSLSVSEDGQVFRDGWRHGDLIGERIDLTPVAGHLDAFWLKVSAKASRSKTQNGPGRLSRLRVVAVKPSLAFPNVPIAALLVLTPVLAYLTRGLSRREGGVPFSLAVLAGLVALSEVRAVSHAELDPRRWWELVVASQEGDFYFLVPYATLLGLFGWQIRVGRGSSLLETAWARFALMGILALGASKRLGALAETAWVQPGPDVMYYMRFADAMQSPYDTGWREPLWIWMIKGWLWLTGHTALHLRTLTVGLSLLLIVVAYRLFRDYTGRTMVGLLAAGLLAMNPFLISLSVRGLRAEAYMIAILCLTYVIAVGRHKWSLWHQATALALAGAAVQLLRFNSYVFVGPLLAIWAWRQGPVKWKAVLLPLAFITVVSVPHLLHNAQEYDDPLYSINFPAVWARNYEFVVVKQIGCEGCPSREEFLVECCTGPRVSAFEYLFGLHSWQEIISRMGRGYLDIYLRPTPLFEMQSGTRSWFAYAFYLLGLGLVFLSSYRETVALIILLANGLPFTMTLGIDPRHVVHTAPFVALILAYGVSRSCEWLIRLWESAEMNEGRLRLSIGLGRGSIR